MTTMFENLNVTLKIKDDKGEAVPITLHLDRLHETWIKKLVEYGARRFPNDTHSAAKGDAKVEAIRLMIADMEKGNEAPERVASSGSTVDPVKRLALSNAKAALTAMFKAVTGATKAIDFAKHEKVSPFFKVTEDRATWNDETVVKWIEKQKADGKADYMADAEKALAVTESDDTEDLLDF